MRVQDGRGVLRMELCTDVPALLRNLDNLDEVGGGVDTHTLHAGLLIFLSVGIVELVAVAMTLADNSLTPCPSPNGEGSR